MPTPARQEYLKHYYELNKERIRAKTAQWVVENPERAAAGVRRWVDAHPTRRREIHHRSRLKRRYGITPEAYQTLLDAQSGVCAICGQPEVNSTSTLTKFLCVDHCHTTGKIRGLLCKSCNIALGSVKDSQERLLAAAAYLEERS